MKKINYLDLFVAGFNSVEDKAHKQFTLESIKTQAFLKQKEVVDPKKKLYKTLYHNGVELWFIEDSESILMIGCRVI